ncbi:MAG TPA: hypothetical protein VM165_16455 [Planctomycetaceae bacterium]|nr:hypothetical protein [Planctomycetaceae bacterium]
MAAFWRAERMLNTNPTDDEIRAAAAVALIDLQTGWYEIVGGFNAVAARTPMGSFVRIPVDTTDLIVVQNWRERIMRLRESAR